MLSGSNDPVGTISPTSAITSFAAIAIDGLKFLAVLW